jgi:hypothetical protein
MFTGWQIASPLARKASHMSPLITVAHVSSNLVDVTPEQIGRCYAVVGPDGKKFYQVENSEGKFNEAGEMIEYKVTYNKEQSFQCTCKSGQHGFANVKHASGVCWHVRASVAAAIEEKQALHDLVVVQPEVKEMNILILDGKQATPEEYDRIVNAKAKPVNRRAKLYSPKFSFLR